MSMLFKNLFYSIGRILKKITSTFLCFQIEVMTEDTNLTPSWLTKEVLEKIIFEKFDNKKVCVECFKVERAVPKGTNYVCDVLRTRVHYKMLDENYDNDCEITSFILKLPKTGGMSEFIMQTGMVQRETMIYSSVVPKLVNISGKNVFTPGCYTSPVLNVLIFEDLHSLGYKMADRKTLLSFEESVIALRALARFHAVSVKCHKEYPELIESFTDLRFNEKIRQTKPEAVEMFFGNAAVGSLKWPELKRFSTKFSEYKDRAWDLLLNVSEFDENNFNVLNHDDFWINNMLFKYSENNDIVDVKLIDFQNTSYNTPAKDLTYFFTGSVKQEILETKYNELLSEYLLELNLNLEKMRIDTRLHIDELEKYMKKMRIFSLYAMVNLLPIVLADESVAYDLSEVSDDEFRGNEGCFAQIYFENERYVDCLAGRLTEFEKGGWP